MLVLPEVVREALYGVAHHPLRSGLSMLGISWGIISVVILLAYGNGFHAAIFYGLNGAFSTGTILARPGQTSMQAGGQRAGRRIQLTPADAEAIGELPFIKAVSPEHLRRYPISYREKLATQAVRGVSPEYGMMRHEAPAPGQGRFINAEDVARQRRVAFIGQEVYRKLFGGRPAVGETIRIAGLWFEIVGVLEDKVQMSSYFSPDKYCVFIPYTTMGHLTDTRYVNVIVLQTVSPMMQGRAIRQVAELLARRHRYNAADERAVVLDDTVEMMETVNGITGGLRLVLTFIGILTLAIGGIGIMNIMFVSVTERTREIGIRKALGGRRRHILLQFLLEGLIITCLGGAIGIVASYALVWLLSPRPFLAELMDDPTGKTDIQLLLSPDLLAMTVGILCLVGLVSGLLPALRAARMDPIESLRYE